jgi:hypothetical protein
MNLEDLIHEIQQSTNVDYCKELLRVFLAEQKAVCSLYIFPTRYSSETRYNIKNCLDADYIGIVEDIETGKIDKNYRK